MTYTQFKKYITDNKDNIKNITNLGTSGYWVNSHYEEITYMDNTTEQLLVSEDNINCNNKSTLSFKDMFKLFSF